MVDARKIAILGAGRIGEALISGLLSSGWREPAEVAATSRRAERVEELRERYGVAATLSNRDAAAGAALVVIASRASILRNGFQPSLPSGCKYSYPASGVMFKANRTR